MPMILRKIEYQNLNSRQKENYNFHKFSALIADFGFTTLRLNDDWHGADLIAQHVDGETFIRVQLKGRLCFYKKCQGKDLYIAFRHESIWYLYPRGELLKRVSDRTKISTTKSWTDEGGYSFPSLSVQMHALLNEYKVVAG
jgi:hypothetical protein